ncbi:hypothetical protein ACFVZ8_18290 [Streptomyces sp. NPDC059558]|uniref:hypothetical protein n=1 Tax=Streptomyces sp. NPDC059558 TaxID=3346864 RepID=UPI003697EC1F
MRRFFGRKRGVVPHPPELLAAAAENPGGSVAQIDTEYASRPDGYVPTEAILGVWLVGADGKPTGVFEKNPNYGLPTVDDFEKLTGCGHYLGWLGDPAAAVRDSVAGCLAEQAPGAHLEWLKILDEPRYLTGVRVRPDLENRTVITRAGLALAFALSVTAPERRREILTGVFTWVSAPLDEPGMRKDQVWLDLWMGLDRAEALLQDRILLVGRTQT